MPLPQPTTAERSGQLALILPGLGEKQSAVDVPIATNLLTDSAPITSKNWLETVATIVDIFDCLGEDPADEELTRILYRVSVEGNFHTPTVTKLLAYAYGVAGAPVGVAQNTVQTVTLAAQTSGSYKLALTYLGGTETTGDIPWNATATQMRQALEALPNVGYGNVTVTLAGSVYTITFIGKRASASVPAFVPTNNLNVGGTVTVAVTTVGSQKASNITRNTGYQNPYFSFAIGFRDDANSFFLCYNAVVNNIRITAPANGGVVTFAAEIIFSGKSPLLGFTPPACYVPPTVRTQDCAFTYSGADQSPNLYSMEWVFDNGTLTGDSAYPGRRITPSRLERANRRTSGLTVALIGKGTDAVYLDAVPPGRKNVTVAAQFGTEGDNHTITIPNAIWKWSGGNSGLRFEGESEESRLNFLAAPKKVGATQPSSVVANTNLTQTLLTAG